MTALGQVCLLVALVGSGYAALAAIVARGAEHRAVRRSGDCAAAAAVLALTAATALLVWALIVKDFRFAYVAQYSSRRLAWHYSLSALWVGQAGSLLLWSWLLGVLGLAFRFWPRRQANPLRDPAFGIAAAYLCFLVSVMVFGADPMAPSAGSLQDGAGLGPLLQHPAMLLHPPVMFLGYACYVFPFALAIAALATGQIDASWPREIRSWALAGWAVLGLGILVGADWAYEELGWGGYWGWDPVENASLIPWLTGTALVHASMAWQRRGVLKQTSLLLAIATFGLCNFAAFLTRSGVFSSLHTFSRSPIGWMFLALLAAIAAAAGILFSLRRAALVPDRPIRSTWAREALVILSSTGLVLLAALALGGTLTAPVTGIILGRSVVVGSAFYNAALVPIGLLLLAATAIAPLTRWGSSPSPAQRTLLTLAGGAAVLVAAAAFAAGVRQPIALGVAGLAAVAAVGLVGAVVLDVLRRAQRGIWPALVQTVRDRRRTYAGFVVHLGFVFLAIGLTGSSLGTMKHEAVMHVGETIQWAGRSIRFARVIQRDLPDKLAVEAQLDVSRPAAPVETLFPAQHFHWLENEWTTEVAIQSTWAEDFYTILHGGEGPRKVALTLVVNPLMRWLWLGGWIAGIGAVCGLLPGRRPARGSSAVPAPHLATHLRSRACPS